MSGTAVAQTSGSVSVVSDYLYRGVSLSEGGSAAQAGIEYDGAAGWYGGLFASQVAFEDSPTHVQLIAYGGLARRFGEGWSVDAGVTAVHYVQAAAVDYQEGYVGLSAERVGGRISYSPDYLGLGVHTVYGELNANLPLSGRFERWRLLAHAGYLHVPLLRPYEYATTATRYDTRLGISATFGAWDAQLAWVAVERSRAPTYYGNDPNPRTAVASLTYSY